MKNQSIPESVRRRFQFAHSRWGRRYLNLMASAQRWRWRAWLGLAAMSKRAFDIIGSFSLLVALSPLLLLIACWIKWEDGGAVFFAQKRVGQFGRGFRMFKFRSMCPDAEARLAALLAKNQHAEGVTFKMQDDPRVTRAGRWLRRFSLDELPQFLNVLRGDMSLVGPRPPVPREVALYTLADRRRLAVVPGITCYWQVSGRSQIDFSGQVRLDVKYIEDRTFWKDVRIVCQTLPAMLAGDGAC